MKRNLVYNFMLLFVFLLPILIWGTNPAYVVISVYAGIMSSWMITLWILEDEDSEVPFFVIFIAFLFLLLFNWTLGLAFFLFMVGGMFLSTCDYITQRSIDEHSE